MEVQVPRGKVGPFLHTSISPTQPWYEPHQETDLVENQFLPLASYCWINLQPVRSSPISYWHKGGHRNVQPWGWLLLGAHRLTACWHQEILKLNISSPSLQKSTQEDAHARATSRTSCELQRSSSIAFVTTCHPSEEAGPDLSKGPEHTPALPRCHHFQARHVLSALSSTHKPLQPARSIASFHNAVNFSF